MSRAVRRAPRGEIKSQLHNTLLLLGLAILAAPIVILCLIANVLLAPLDWFSRSR